MGQRSAVKRWRQSILSSNQRFDASSTDPITLFFQALDLLTLAPRSCLAQHIQPLLPPPALAPLTHTCALYSTAMQHTNYLYFPQMYHIVLTSLPFCVCSSLGREWQCPPKLQAKFFSIFKILLRYHLQETSQSSFPPSLLISASCTFVNRCTYTL